MDIKFNENISVFIANPSNLRYFTNYNNSDAYIIFIGKNKFYFTDGRYFEEARNNISNYNIMDINDLEHFFKDNVIEKIGIENSLSHSLYNKLQSYGVKEFFEIDTTINRVRAIKSPQEIEYIKKAQEITDKTFENIIPMIKEGITEIELAGTLESLLYINGAHDLAFKSIVAFGENTSMPHASRTDKKLTNGSLITLDFGAKYYGYCSDMTRTIAFGKISDEQYKIYNHVLTAQNLTLGIVYAGITAKECDTMARKYFEEFNLDRYFIHSLGHGVGLDIHEYPILSPKSTAVLEENMVVTIEPGLYFEKQFGIRIEDLILFNKTGIINLTKSPKNIIIL